MNPPRCIWSDLPLKTGIATLVSYAGVFGDVIGIEEMAAKLGVSGQEEYHSALNELHLRGKIILQDGFAGLPELGDKMASKSDRIETARQLIKSRIDCIKKIGRSPIIRFVGISGSLAANNPVRDKHNHLDIDLFLITRNQCLWLYIIPRNIRNLFPRSKQEQVLCDNYIMDESNLVVANRNIYTATEIRNLIPVCGMEAYTKFLQANNWVDYYYPGFSGASAPATPPTSGNWGNKIFYLLFSVLRSLKHRNLESLRKISFRSDARGGINFNMLSTCYGGYQSLVQKKFTQIFENRFPDLLNTNLIEKLFPDELSVEIRKGEIDVLQLITDLGLGYDYSKYG